MTLVGTDGLDLITSRAVSRLAHLLDRAGDQRASLAEQARRLAQFSGSLDTFFLTGGSSVVDATEALGTRMRAALHDLSVEQDRLLHDVLLPAAAAVGMQFPNWHELPRHDRARLRAWFLDNAYPVITPMSVDATHPFPRLVALALNLGVLLRDRRTSVRFACVQVPSTLPRFVRLDRQRTVLTEAIIGGTLEALFAGMDIVDRAVFRVTRMVDTTPLRAPGAPYVLAAAERGAAVRLEVQHTASDGLIDELVTGLGTADDCVYRCQAPLGLITTLAAVTSRSQPPVIVVEPVSIPAALSEPAGSL